MALLHTPLPPRPLLRDDLPLGGVIAVTAVGGALGAALDTAHGAPARTLFALFLALAAVLAARTVRREQVLATVVAVPLVYVVLLLLGGVAAHDGSLTAWLAMAFVLKAPVVLIATAAAAVAALLRRTR